MRLAYYRVSSGDQSIESQRHAMGGGFDREFDEGELSGMVPQAQRPEFAELLKIIRPGDELHVFDVSRLGRDALDIQATARQLMRAGVTVHILGLGALKGEAGELILAVLAQVADMERRRIIARTAAGRSAARDHLAKTGKTHRGKDRLGGQPRAADPGQVDAWRVKHKASISWTAAHFDLSRSTVKRYRRAAGVQIDLETAIRAADEFPPSNPDVAAKTARKFGFRKPRALRSSSRPGPKAAARGKIDPKAGPVDRSRK